MNGQKLVYRRSLFPCDRRVFAIQLEICTSAFSLISQYSYPGKFLNLVNISPLRCISPTPIQHYVLVHSLSSLVLLRRVCIKRLLSCDDSLAGSATRILETTEVERIAGVERPDSSSELLLSKSTELIGCGASLSSAEGIREDW